MYEYVFFGVKFKRDYNGWGIFGVCTCYSLWYYYLILSDSILRL